MPPGTHFHCLSLNAISSFRFQSSVLPYSSPLYYSTSIGTEVTEATRNHAGKMSPKSLSSRQFSWTRLSYQLLNVAMRKNKRLRLEQEPGSGWLSQCIVMKVPHLPQNFLGAEESAYKQVSTILTPLRESTFLSQMPFLFYSFSSFLCTSMQCQSCCIWMSVKFSIFEPQALGVGDRIQGRSSQPAWLPMAEVHWTLGTPFPFLFSKLGLATLFLDRKWEH